MQEPSIQKFNIPINLGVGVAVAIGLPVIANEIVPGVGIFLVLISPLLGATVGHIVQGTVDVDEDEFDYISIGVISLALLGLVIIDLASSGLSAGIFEAGIALAIWGVILFFGDVFLFKLLTKQLNESRLKKSARGAFGELKNEYRTAVNQAEQQSDKEPLSGEIIADARSCRERCEDFKSEYGIKQTTYEIDERLEALEAELEQKQARERLDELTERVGDLIDQLRSAEDAGNYDRALELLDDLESPLSEAEEIREEHGFDVGFEMSSDEFEQVRRSLIEGKYQGLLSAAKEARRNAEEQLNRSEYEQARQYADEAIQQANRAKDLAEEWVFLSEQDCVDEREATISLQIKAIGNQAAEIEADLQSREGQESVSSKLGTLETAVKDLERLHQTTTQSDTKKDIVTTAQKTQTVLLAGRILSVEQDASQACERFRRGAETQAKESFEDLVTRLDDIRDRTPDEALEEYETELNDLQSVCETNAERARRQDLGLDSGLTMESVDVLGATLRGESQAQFESASSGNTELFDPSDVQDSTGDTEVFDPSEGGSSGDTEVFDAGDPDG